MYLGMDSIDCPHRNGFCCLNLYWQCLLSPLTSLCLERSLGDEVLVMIEEDLVSDYYIQRSGKIQRCRLMSLSMFCLSPLKDLGGSWLFEKVLHELSITARKMFGKWQARLFLVLRKSWTISYLKPGQIDIGQESDWEELQQICQEKKNHAWQTWLPSTRYKKGKWKSSRCLARWFSKDFVSVSPSILINKLVRCEPDGLPKRQVDDYLIC